MTRFARAKGSKSSNERLPNESTPWHVMKEQLEIALEREQQDTQTKTKSANQLIKEKDDELFYAKSVGQLNYDWAEFTDSKQKAVKSGRIEKKSNDKNIKLKVCEKSITEDSNSKECMVHEDSSSKPLKSKNKSKKTSNLQNVDISVKAENIKHESNEASEVTDNIGDKKLKQRDENHDNISSCKIKNKKQKRKINDVSEMDKNNVCVKKETEEVTKNGTDKDSSNGLSKRQKRNQKKQNQKNESNKEEGNATTFNTEGNDWNNSVDFSKRRKSENNAKQNNFRDNDDIDRKNFRRFGNNVPKKFQKKVAKIRDDREYQSRKPHNNTPMKVTINGMDVEIMKYDGFPVKKEDAERLKELRKTMVMKGIPKSEIDAAMKLERRKCEKALARIRKQVCFHCRKAGHNLSDCPELGKEEAGTGICFKCGSTEHTHFECKVTKSDEYGFAKCFICREQGHIAKQCPDNPKGLYPDGGCCKVCGDVTHLKKDCPNLVQEKEETAVTLDTISDKNLESLETESNKPKTNIKASKKIVKF